MNERIKKIMAKSFDVPAETITSQTNKDEIESWDSLHHIMMIVALEKEFKITIPDEEVGNMISFGLIESVIISCYETYI